MEKLCEVEEQLNLDQCIVYVFYLQLYTHSSDYFGCSNHATNEGKNVSV